jgi:2-dehydropantoate 2-reductase
MKIAVVGCGAVGSYYGAKLCRAGHDVHFLLRSDYDSVQRNGVWIRSAQGDFTVRPHCAKSAAEIGPSDVVLIGLKTTANDQFPRLIPPLIGNATAVVTLQNGLGNEEMLATVVPAAKIFGGLCFVCLNRVAPGVIHHIDHGAIVLGHYQHRPDARTQALASMFQGAGITCKVADNLSRAHWEKLVWNVPFNGLGVGGVAGYEALVSETETSQHKRGGCLTTQQLLSDARWENLVRELMLEVIRSANALGFDIPEGLAEKQIERTRSMGAYKASTLLDFETGRPLELASLFLEPLRQAEAAGASVPRLRQLCRVLTGLDAGTV